MKIAISIVKNILQPQFKKDNKLEIQKLTDVFWKNLNSCFLDFESDPKPLYALIYSLELEDPEKVISKLPEYYATFLKELAESYVLGIPSYTHNYLIQKQNKTFLEYIRFFKTLQQVVKKIERKRMKENLQASYDRLIFELSETNIANASKKKGREDLKSKMKNWDEQLEEIPVVSMVNNKREKIEKSKVISLSWMKYASIAAIFIIGFMIWQPNKLSNDKLFSQYNSDESIIKSIDYQKMITISESSNTRGGEILFQNYSKSETEAAITAIELFKNENFEKSRQILININPREKNNQLLLLLAIAQLKTNHVEQAVSNLEYLNTISNYEFADEVKFRLALGYINQNKKRNAKSLLVYLVRKSNKYSNTAQEILDNMRWF